MTSLIEVWDGIDYRLEDGIARARAWAAETHHVVVLERDRGTHALLLSRLDPRHAAMARHLDLSLFFGVGAFLIMVETPESVGRDLAHRLERADRWVMGNKRSRSYGLLLPKCHSYTPVPLRHLFAVRSVYP